MTTGLAVYPAYQGNPIPGRLALAMGRHEWAIAFRKLNPRGYLILRPDEGNDEAQFDDIGTDPVNSAQIFYSRFILPAMDHVPANTYSATLGPCETWHVDKLHWRAAFELALCNMVRDNLAIDYIALSCPVGNLDSSQVSIFFDVFRAARWISYHGYLGYDVQFTSSGGVYIHRSKLPQETDSWFLWRPLLIWLPILKAAGIPLRLLYTEIGTGPRPEDVGLSKHQLALLDVEIAKALEATHKELGVELGGALPFAFGAEGNMGANWNLDGYENYFVEETTMEWILAFADYAKLHPEKVGNPITGIMYDGQGNAWQYSDRGMLFSAKGEGWKVYWHPKA